MERTQSSPVLRTIGIFLIIFFTETSTCMAQSDSLSSLSVWMFGDVYYHYDFNNPDFQERPPFLYSHNRHNEFALNNGVVGVKYNSISTRANIAFHTGTYVSANYAHEPVLFRNIYEANVGFSPMKDIWIDLGVLPSHIGVESALSIENHTLTRSFMAENSPYYEAGLKVNYLKNKWSFAILVLNGWQRIQNNNNKISLGSQLQYNSDLLVLNYSNFFGDESPQGEQKLRFFQNFYSIFQLHPKLSLTSSFDLGMEESDLNNHAYWYASSLVSRYKLSPKAYMNVRLEYYSDMQEVIVNNSFDNGFRTSGISLGFDRFINKAMLFRLESRYISSDLNIDFDGTRSFAVIGSLSFMLDKAIR